MDKFLLCHLHDLQHGLKLHLKWRWDCVTSAWLHWVAAALQLTFELISLNMSKIRMRITFRFPALDMRSNWTKDAVTECVYALVCYSRPDKQREAVPGLPISCIPWKSWSSELEISTKYFSQTSNSTTTSNWFSWRFSSRRTVTRGTITARGHSSLQISLMTSILYSSPENFTTLVGKPFLLDSICCALATYIRRSKLPKQTS